MSTIAHDLDSAVGLASKAALATTELRESLERKRPAIESVDLAAIRSLADEASALAGTLVDDVRAIEAVVV